MRVCNTWSAGWDGLLFSLALCSNAVTLMTRCASTAHARSVARMGLCLCAVSQCCCC